MPLGRLNAERGWWQKPDPEGQSAVTNWKVLGRGGASPGWRSSPSPGGPINCASTLQLGLADCRR